MNTTQPVKDVGQAKKSRRDGLLLLVLGSVVFVLLGVVLENGVPGPMSDFKAIYLSTRCLLEHNDPYKSGVILQLYQAEGGQFPTDPIIARSVRRSILVCINLPTALFFIIPFAILPWGLSHLLWMGLIAGGLILAAFLTWNLGADCAPALCGALVALLLANSEVLLVIGNAAGIAISLCLVAVWCFLRNRFAHTGVVCLAISLVLKPHDAGLVWLYFLLAGGVYRKRALQTLAVVIVLAIPAILWVSHVAPHWMQELHSNLVQASSRGDLNDPGPSSMSAGSLGMIVSLQSVVSVFRDDPGFYNPVTYLICVPLLVVWAFTTLRTRVTQAGSWLALASIAALTMLPVYHRQYDTKLLLLTIPACVMLWAKGGVIGWIAVLLNTVGFLLTGDLTSAVLLALIGHLHMAPSAVSRYLLTALQAFPAPLLMLVMGIFYLWVYMRSSPRSASETEAPS